MISNLIRKALGPTLDNRLNGESIRLNAVINEMENAIADMNSISAPDIADNINTYDIAQDINIDASDIDIDYAALARHIGYHIEINASDLDIDYRNLAERIASEIYSADHIGRIERKQDLILKYLGITPENA